MTRTRIASITLAALVVTGCGASVNVHASGTTPTSTPSSSPGQSSSAGQTTFPATGLAPDLRRVTAKASRLSIGVPRSWVLINAAKLSNPQTRARLAAAARGMNLTLDQFQQLAQQVDLFAIAQTVPNKQQNLNVVSEPAVEELPSAAAIRSGISALNATVLDIRDVTTPLGRGRLVEFRIAIRGHIAAYGVSVYAQPRSGLAQITVTTTSLASAIAMFDRIIPTVRDIGSGTNQTS
ncbi:MAG: hypothetical protein JWR52_1752 [Marmoricola sp.]|nr:hypothetical protein [Marmoricola sp.]